MMNHLATKSGFCVREHMAQKMYKAKTTPASGGSGVEVTVPANDPFQAKKMIEVSMDR